MPLSRLLHGIADTVAIPVAGLQIDSRRVRSGDLFVALPGEQHDGRDYLGDVARAGAVAAVVESGLSEPQRRAAGQLPVVEIGKLSSRVGEIAAAFYRHPSDAMVTVGITGTNGKTTTSRVLAQLLRTRFGSCGVIGTLGATLGNDTGAAANTTPDALSLQAQLSEWREQSVAAAVLEVSSHSLVQGRVGGMHFNTAVFTNLTHDHLDYHGDMENYGLAKSLLFQSQGLEAAVINRDDAYAATLGGRLAPGVECIEYSLQPGATVSASTIRYHDSGLEARIHSPWGEGLLHSPLAGDFNLSNLLAAISVACLAGMTLEDALAVVPRLSGVDGRMQYVPNTAGLQLVVDYAHTPDALAKALQALRAHTRGRLHCVFGCGGDRDRDKRAVMGQVAAQFADRLVVTSDNPRSEDPAAIVEDILAGIEVAADVETERGAAITLAVQSATAGDCVLVAGKGHETYQEIGSRRLPFSDVEQILMALEVSA
jgi:UDP-N-acetylmuramoyl-L-alanyl-D-glutamate--2,6-diaminopimelate ligase